MGSRSQQGYSREDYLEALGVGLYWAKKPLPGAKPSLPREALIVREVPVEGLDSENVEYAAPVHSSAQSVEELPKPYVEPTQRPSESVVCVEEAAVASTSLREPHSNAQATVGRLDRGALFDKLEPESTSGAQSSPAKGSTAFRVALWVEQWANRFLMVFELSDPSATQPTSRERRIIEDMRVALRFSEAAKASKGQQEAVHFNEGLLFQWPIRVRGQVVDGSAEDAIQALSAFLRKQPHASGHGSMHWVLLSSKIQPLFSSQPSLSQETSTAISLPSLFEMKAAERRLLWRYLGEF